MTTRDVDHRPPGRATGRPDFLIIGAMKCMTSTLHEQLALQPGFCMSEPKEPFYFSNDEVFARGDDWYRGLWARRSKGDLCGESSTHYAKLPTYPDTVSRIVAACPDVKLIYIMRHPIDRLVSQYVHEWSMGFVTDPIDGAIETLPILVDYSRYAYQLRPYLETFGARQVLPVFFDRLQSRPQHELQRVCDFLGYSRDDGPTWHHDRDSHNVGAQRMRKSPWRDRLAYAPGVSWARRTLVPVKVREQIKDRWRMRSKPTLSESRRSDLVEAFDADLAELSRWLGLDSPLRCETFNAVTSELVPRWHDEAFRLKDAAGHHGTRTSVGNDVR